MTCRTESSGLGLFVQRVLLLFSQEAHFPFPMCSTDSEGKYRVLAHNKESSLLSVSEEGDAKRSWGSYPREMNSCYG